MRSIYAGREDDTWWVDGGSVADTWRKRGGESHDLCQTFHAASGQALARRLPARRRRSSRLSLYRCSYFRWKTSRQRAPANAIGTPIRAGKLYPNPIATGMPPRKAPTALPRLKAAWMQQPPSISPPSACFTIRNCSGDPMPKKTDTADEHQHHRDPTNGGRGRR